MTERARRLLALCCCLGACGAAPAAASNFNDFLPGAKAMGMGFAYTAVADDPYAMFFNPAGTANTPYAQLGTSLGRVLSPVGTMSFGALTYVRPFEPINTATVGSAYYAERQTNGGDKDQFLFHYSQELKLLGIPLSKPLRVGGNFKFINVDKGRGHGGGRFGAGFDGGLLLRSNSGLNGSLAVTDLTTSVGVPRPTLSLGTAYTWQKWLTAAGDLRIRSNLTEFYPGVEASFLEGLLKARIGKGFALDGVSNVAFGMGVNFSPVVLDVAMSVPTGGIHREGGAYQATFNYRFGAPSFAGTFVGQAAAQAEALRADISRLEEQKRAIEDQTKTAETHREISEGEVRVLEQRVKELEGQYRGLQKSKDELGYQIEEEKVRQKVLTAPEPEAPRLPRAPKKPAPSWPRRHVVQPGETLRSLAKKYYGDANLWEQIYDANRDKVERGLPQEGAEFVIPAPKQP